MGKLVYGVNVVEIGFDDRTLAHLSVVIIAKLRRRESFLFSWRDDSSVGDGRSSVWIDPSIPLYFKYFGSRPPSLNRAWVAALTATANSAQGLHLVPEPNDGDGAGGDEG
ncbi:MULTISPECIES: ATP-dependent DNA ligase [unclassified Curtobacterium]|uniref:DUF7882 family protein n=1 Tax=unclassified Curtobacterium TaxID=257496 RepID=UPI000DA84399|nr:MULTISPECIES: ATP-dependent DNA ligase [unclassified Curtobacterium]WIB63821.1 ATP-dependent DNA ligase [Curtobacterium sp. MCBD17_040]WIB67662.1 ATP-dependent DNA ligase [Curtobacterium sp. MCBD17_035]